MSFRDKLNKASQKQINTDNNNFNNTNSFGKVNLNEDRYMENQQYNFDLSNPQSLEYFENYHSNAQQGSQFQGYPQQQKNTFNMGSGLDFEELKSDIDFSPFEQPSAAIQNQQQTSQVQSRQNTYPVSQPSFQQVTQKPNNSEMRQHQHPNLNRQEQVQQNQRAMHQSKPQQPVFDLSNQTPTHPNQSKPIFDFSNTPPQSGSNQQQSSPMFDFSNGAVQPPLNQAKNNSGAMFDLSEFTSNENKPVSSNGDSNAFDLTQFGQLEQSPSVNSNKEPVFDLIGGFEEPVSQGNPSLGKNDISLADFQSDDDFFSQMSGANSTDLSSLFGANDTKESPLPSLNSQDESFIMKKSKMLAQKKKTKDEEIQEYIDDNQNFWYKMNAIYIANPNADKSIDYAKLTAVREPDRIDFSILKKQNYKLYSAIEHSLKELVGKYHELVDEIKKSNIFAGEYDKENLRLDDIDINKLRGKLNYRYDNKIRNFLKSFNPYYKTIKGAEVIQEPKDLAVYKTEFETDVIYDVLGQSAIFPFLKNPDINEIMVIGPYKVYIEMKGRLVKTKVAFADDNPLKRYAKEISAMIDRPLDSINLSVDARLPDGSRFHGILPPIARNGTTLTIRKFTEEKLRLDDLITYGSLTENMAHMIRSSVSSKLNVVVAGGTGSGKTTMLNICSNYIGKNERTITVEDSAELQLIQDHVVSLETKEAKKESNAKSYTIRDLVKETLRMRPDRILCGEVRGGEAWDMLVAMNTGHEGSMTTVHANNPVDTVKRIANMVAQVAGDGVPMRVIFEQIASSVDLIVYQARLHDGSRKTTYISEVKGYNTVTQTIEINDLYKFVITHEDEEGNIKGEFKWTGNLPSADVIYRIKSKGNTLPPEMEEALAYHKEEQKTTMTLEQEQELVDSLQLEVRVKERLKVALEVLRIKESENDMEIVENLDVPLSFKNKLKKLLAES